MTEQTTALDFRTLLDNRGTLPFLGIYDIFSARLMGRRFDTLFVSGLGFAASHYGLPDMGCVCWSDLIGFVHRLRAVLPHHALLVDLDDGFGEDHTAEHAARLLESAGASGIVLEDQKRPRRCGHLDGKQVLPLDEALRRLERVLNARKSMFVIARTDAPNWAEALSRVTAFSEAGADAVLIDGIADLSRVGEIASCVRRPIAFNQIAGGKSQPFSLSEMRDAGVSIAIYSTPALFAAQWAIEQTIDNLSENGGRLPRPGEQTSSLRECNAALDHYPQDLPPIGDSASRIESVGEE